MELGWLTALVSGPYLSVFVGLGNLASGFGSTLPPACACEEDFKTTAKQPIADVNMIDIAAGTTV